MCKYYTPKIEDIHVGLEVERHEWSIDEAGDPKLNYDRWVKSILTKRDISIIMEHGITGIRVKCLDGQDIEEY